MEWPKIGMEKKGPSSGSGGWCKSEEWVESRLFSKNRGFVNHCFSSLVVNNVIMEKKCFLFK